MTVKELIERMEEIEDKEAVVLDFECEEIKGIDEETFDKAVMLV